MHLMIIFQFIYTTFMNVKQAE